MNGPSVAHLIAPAPIGGAESVVRELAAGRAESGRPTRVFLLGDPAEPPPLADALRARGVAAHLIPTGGRSYGRQARSVRALLRREGIRILHTHAPHADVIGALACPGTPARPIATVHGHVGLQGLRGSLHGWADRFVLRILPRVIAVSHATRMHLVRSGVPDPGIRTVRNGAPLGRAVERAAARRRLGIPPEGPPVLGWVGRMSREKGLDLLAPALRELIPPYRLLLIGDGPCGADAAALARGLSGRGIEVLRLGPRPDAGELMAAFDVLLLPSRVENLPMVMLEAAAAGVPTVGYAVGGVPEFLDGETGWPVPPGDAGAFREALHLALSGPSLRRVKGEQARARVRAAFSTGAMVDGVESVYSELAAGLPSARPRTLHWRTTITPSVTTVSGITKKSMAALKAGSPGYPDDLRRR